MSYPWTPSESQALWESAQHHLENLQDPMKASYSAHDCACCQMIVFGTGGSAYSMDCHGCPISQATGFRGCEGIAYERAHGARARLREAEYLDPGLYQEWKEAQTKLYQELVEMALGELGPIQEAI